jgi:phospholipid/cholesterol/gamma-HCH transport system ATP-binding protein
MNEMGKKSYDAADVVIDIRALNKSFGDNHVLRDFNLQLRKGENIVVLGKSGSGKSVLIKCIIGLMAADSGTIDVLGRQIGKINHDELDLLRERIGFLFQSNALYDSMSVRENLLFPLRRHRSGISAAQTDELIREVLGHVDLAHTIDMMPSELSGGMKKRIALARALILKPEIMLYDEPTTGLDPITGKGISMLMLDVQKKYNTSSIIISHDLNCVKIIADRIIMLIDGYCYASGTYEELKNAADKKVNHFFE